MFPPTLSVRSRSKVLNAKRKLFYGLTDKKDCFTVLQTKNLFIKQKAWRWKYQVFWFPSLLETQFFTGSPKLRTVIHIFLSRERYASSCTAHTLNYWTARDNSERLEAGWTSASDLVTPSWCLVMPPKLPWSQLPFQRAITSPVSFEH